MPLLTICKCGALVPQTPCQTCRTRANKQRNQRPNATGVYNTTRWRKVRARVLEANDHQCAHCGNPATTVDHIQPFTNPDDPLAWDEWNLQPLCTHCHGRKDGTRARNAT